mmetsp:Transcript_57596/g.51909  ORF Transcript_57596/g.51909 Transcript_57596/m.51909 type:complete len:264 (+) Transcript_57596:40-831(+)
MAARSQNKIEGTLRELSLISGYFRDSSCNISSTTDPVVIYHAIHDYYKKPILKEIMQRELSRKYGKELAKCFSTLVQNLQWDDKQIYFDISTKHLQSKILDHIIAYHADIDKYELHDELRKICYGKKHYSGFNTNSSKYFHTLQARKIHGNNDNNGGKIISFDGIYDDTLTEKLELDILVFMYSFAYEWMFIDEKKRRNLRNKMDICLHHNLQFIFKDVNEMRVSPDLCKKFIENAKVNRSCYFVRNVLNQYFKNTFFPLTTI